MTRREVVAALALGVALWVILAGLAFTLLGWRLV